MNDLASFFDNADGFVVPASLSAGPTIYVHFDNAYVDALGVASASPAATCKSTDVAGAAQGSALTVDGTAYVVQSVEPDGAGITVLRLSRT